MTERIGNVIRRRETKKAEGEDGSQGDKRGYVTGPPGLACSRSLADQCRPCVWLWMDTDAQRVDARRSQAAARR